MLLPDQTYEADPSPARQPTCQPARPAPHPARLHSRIPTATLPAQPARLLARHADQLQHPALLSAAPPAPLPALLRAHRVRPDFFCANRSRRFKDTRKVSEGVCDSPESRKRRRRTTRTPRPLGSDASSSNEAVHLQRRLLSLSSELVTLRNHLHVAAPGPPPDAQPAVPPRAPAPPHTDPRWRTSSASAAPPAPPAPQAPAPAGPAPPPAGPGPPPAGPGPGAPLEADDLIHLWGPLTEDAVVRALQTRFYQNKFYTSIGPILVGLNAYGDASNALTLSAARAQRPELARLVHDAVRHQADTGYPQAIILSGVSGSGKTYASMVLLRRLFDVAGGGPETDAFKHLAAAFTVLRSLGTAATAANSHSSRIGHFIEVQVTDGALYRTKIHCYFLEQTRVVRPPPGERNYHVFYQLLAGLSAEERAQFHLDQLTAQDLRYLASAQPRRPDPEDAARFLAWKTCLGILGIPFLDVVRVLSAVLVLGNVQFSENAEGFAENATEAELAAAAALLGVPGAALLRGLTSRSPRAARPRHARRRRAGSGLARQGPVLPHRSHDRAASQLAAAAGFHAGHAVVGLQRLGGGGRRRRRGGSPRWPQRRRAARHARLRGHPRHVRLRGRRAVAPGAPVRQPVRGDHAALLQHARVQVGGRDVPRGGRAVRAGGGLRRQRAVHRPGVVAARRAAGRAGRRVRRARRPRPLRGAHQGRS